jgi:predicted HD superfamily hydrolase involved in NAD metabolism
MTEKTIINIYEFLENQFLHNQSRLKHILAVLKVALDLGEIFGVDKDKITISALMHDSTKNKTFQENLDLASKMFSEGELKIVPAPCLHAYSAAALAKIEFGISDQEILNAITYHCSGRLNMSVLEKVIFVADFIEESRDFVEDYIKETAYKNLDLATYLIMKETENYLIKNNRRVSKLTTEAIEAYENLEVLNDGKIKEN